MPGGFVLITFSIPTSSSQFLAIRTGVAAILSALLGILYFNRHKPEPQTQTKVLGVALGAHYDDSWHTVCIDFLTGSARSSPYYEG